MKIFNLPTFSEGDAAEINVPNETALNEQSIITPQQIRNLSTSLFKPTMK